ncbi:MAG TPA: hypothetical protein VFG10_10585 [Saprospiraceae bacterium]|nr:hypothetical protein [Saprospiraceae bacterium]
MKKLFFFLLPLLVLSCKGVEQYRPAVEEVATSWDATTKAASDFSAMVSSDMTNYTKAMASMNVDEATMAKLKPEQVTAWQAAQKGVTDALSAYAPLQKTIGDFMTTWQEKSAEVNALKEGLTKGKIEGDVNAKVTELKALIATANENMTAWTASYATIKNGVAAALTNLQQMMASYAAPAAATVKPATPMKKK